MRRCLEHRVLATHLISVGWHLEFILHPAHDIQIRHTGLDHHHVGAFSQIKRHFLQRLVGIPRVHLISVLVTFTQITGGTHGIAKWAVKGRSILGRISQNARVDLPGLVQLSPNPSNATVHHV
ncbi:MAG: Response regulator receiver protein [uncultured bacterium]|nr:MAG: Response regulator receiver protein [uncultured bacterium]